VRVCTRIVSLALALAAVPGLAAAAPALGDTYSVEVLSGAEANLGPVANPGSVVFRISRQGSLDAATIAYRTSDVTAAGGRPGALAPTDYESQIGRTSLAVGVDHVDIGVPLIGDEAYDGPETFSLTISDPRGASSDTLSQASAQVSILDSALPPCQATEPPAAEQTFTVHGRARSLLVHVPPGQQGRPLPVVLALHGFRSDAHGFERYSGLSALADRAGFIVAYPSAPAGEWYPYAGQLGALGALDYLSASLERLDALACIDSHRRFVAGVSNGAGEAARLACDRGGAIAAVALVSGDYRSLPACHPPHPISVFEIHGTRDPVVPYPGRASDHSGSVPRFLASWRRIDRCRVPGRRSHPRRRFVLTRWSCSRHTAVSGLKVTGMGHDWPMANPPPGMVPGPGSGAYELWRFFSSLPGTP